MSKRTKALALPLLILCGLKSAFALDWPTGPVDVSGDFGTAFHGFLLPGMRLAGEGREIRATSASEVSFARETFDSHSSLPSTFGAMMVAEGSEEMASIFGYLPELADAQAKNLVQGSLIARSSTVGISSTPFFFFALFDRKTDRWVNPRLFLPALPDGKMPGIRRVSLVGLDRTYILSEIKSVPQGSYTMVIEAVEMTGGSSDPIVAPPCYLRVLVNGEKLIELRTETASTAGGRLSFYPALAKGADLLDPLGLVRLEPRLYTRGRTSIELLVRDFAGNERSVGWTLLVE